MYSNAMTAIGKSCVSQCFRINYAVNAEHRRRSVACESRPERPSPSSPAFSARYNLERRDVISYRPLAFSSIDTADVRSNDERFLLRILRSNKVKLRGRAEGKCG